MKVLIKTEKTINCSIKYFVENGLDVFLLATNAPGRSTFNHVEHRMVKFSKELSGVILEHYKFGSHLDTKGVTVDIDLELNNFEYPGRTLAEIWCGLTTDGNPVVAEFIEDDGPVIVETKSEEWKACHNRQSQYFLQTVKSTDPKCCSSFQSSYLKVVYHHLYQLFTRVTELNGQRCYLLIPVSEHFLAKCLDAWCLLKLQKNFPRKYHSIVPVHLWMKIWSRINVFSLWLILFVL